jgi:hypothetical protein
VSRVRRPVGLDAFRDLAEDTKEIYIRKGVLGSEIEIDRMRNT